MPDINEQQPLLPVQPTSPNRAPSRRKGPVRQRRDGDAEKPRRRPEDDGQGKIIDEYA
jgi:hypothetical protein